MTWRIKWTYDQLNKAVFLTVDVERWTFEVLQTL